MFILFITFLVIGLAGFAVVFMKEFKSEKPQQVSLRNIQPLVGSLGEKAEPAPSVVEDPSHLVELKAVREVFDQKILKLEQMLDEKNRLIDGFQKSAYSEQEQQTQMENLKQILQAQIDELKQQNKELKTELARVVDENMDLQTKVFAVQGRSVPVQEQVEVRPAIFSAGPVRADEVESVQISEPIAPVEIVQESQDQAKTLSLHDIFGADAGDQEKKS